LFILQKKLPVGKFILSPRELIQTYLFFTNSLARKLWCGSRSFHIKTDGELLLINYSCARGNFFIIQVGNFSFSGGAAAAVAAAA
jgi:hypothetical protein